MHHACRGILHHEGALPSPVTGCGMAGHLYGVTGRTDVLAHTYGLLHDYIAPPKTPL